MSEEQIGELFMQKRRRRQQQQQQGASARSSSRHNDDYTTHNYGNGRTTSRGKQSNRNARNAGTNNHYGNRTLEQGRIHSLLQNFGFIYCADRPIDIFFHFSEVQRIHPADLNIGDEVEFFVGPRVQRYKRGGGGNNGEDGEEEKLSAFSIQVLEPGTIQWDIPEDPPGVRRQGRIRRVIRASGKDRDKSEGYSNKGNRKGVEGMIELIGDEDDEDVTEVETNDETQDAVENEENSRKMIIRYMAEDYEPENDDEEGERTARNHRHPYGKNFSLAKRDLVEFDLVTERRTGLKFARSITLIQSERERLEEEAEKKRLESATQEQGVIASLKDGFGFLRSNRRKQKVYFQYSNVCLPDIPDNGEEEEEYVLAEGQDMEFLVVTESDGRISARQVTFLEKGSVVFQQLLASGVTGIVTSCPTPPNSAPSSLNARNKQSSNQLDKEGEVGTIALDDEIVYAPVEMKQSIEDQSINTVTLSHNHSPGGLISQRKDGSRVGLWIRDGDRLLFDVYRDVMDGNCYASPTRYMSPKSSDASTTSDDDKQLSKQAKVRLISPSLAGLAEGTVTAIKDSFGFIRLAERNDDVYFRLTDIFPRDLQRQLLMHANISSAEDDNGSMDNLPGLEVGSEVSFDLSLLPPQGNKDSGRGQGRNNRTFHEKEQLRGQRVTLLPPSTLTLQIPLVQGKKAKIIKWDNKRLYGQIQLDEAVEGINHNQRHPLISQLLESVAAKGDSTSITFHEVQSMKEHRVINDMVEKIEGLQISYIPMNDYGERHPGRICISNKGKSVDSNSELDENDTTSEEMQEVSKYEEDNQQDNQEEKVAKDEPQSKEKNSKTTVKVVKFQKNALSSDFDSQFPNKGDIVTCDVTQLRSGALNVTNIKIVERNFMEQASDSQKNIGKGIVLSTVSSKTVVVTSAPSSSKKKGNEGGRWGNCVKEGKVKKVSATIEGKILLLSDGAEQKQIGSEKNTTSEGPTSESTSEEIQKEPCTNDGDSINTILLYSNSCISRQKSSNGASMPMPKRGDMVSFFQDRTGKPRDIQVVERDAGITVKGHLHTLDLQAGTGLFQVAGTSTNEHHVKLSDVVMCEPTDLKENEPVEGVLHEGRVYGVCRSADIHLESKLGNGLKERPKLNITVRKELKDLGGQIIAQSGMAKGPDGTDGFADGWTQRKNLFAHWIEDTVEQDEKGVLEESSSSDALDDNVDEADTDEQKEG